MMNYKHISTVMFLVSVASFARSFLAVKLFFLVIFLLTHVIDGSVKRKFVIYPRLILFYCFVSLAGIFWSLIGLNNGGDITGIMDNLRLYVIWSMAFIIIFTLLRSGQEIDALHRSMVISGVLICLINFFGLYDYYNQTGLISDGIRKELDLYIGIHEGYIQITSQNIGSLFIIIPYLLSLQFRRDAVTQNSALAKISLVLCLVLAIISGRRALWICIALTPIIIGALFYISDSTSFLNKKGRILISLYIICAAFVLVGLAYFSLHESTDIGFINHLKAAFSSEDERTIQKGYLIESFMESPYVGSGFGMNAGYTRSEIQPWLYELTYHQILFNFGISGTLFFIVLFASYLYLVISSIRRNKSESFIPFCTLVGFVSLLIGAYSNPYLWSFDFLIYIGMLPYLSTYRSGFNTTGMEPRYAG